MRVGIDFDNTIVTYDEIFRSTATMWGLIDGNVRGQKQAIRDCIRLLPDGEQTWQRLQGHVYGKGISDAHMFEGVDSFLRRCRTEGCQVVIVSHKTEFGHYDPDRINLRNAALGWMEAHGFFSAGGYGIPIENIYFEGTRDEKLGRIAKLDCKFFIDDLDEVLSDPAFPAQVARILFSDGARPEASSYAVCPTWREIEEHVFK